MAPLTTLSRELKEARRRTDELFDLIAPDALYRRPIPERHRIIFYLGHLEAFDWNQICRAGLDIASFHPTFDKLFEFGIDPPSGQLPQDTPADWPAENEVRRYNERTRAAVDLALGHAGAEIVNIAIEHRLMHAETLAYIMHSMEDGKIAPGDLAGPRTTGELAKPEMIAIPAGDAVMGRPRGNGFGWDNEFEENCVRVAEFAIAKHKVTNGEYLEFVREGARPPHFWRDHGGQWMQRTMFEEVPLPLDWPVYVTLDEARAFAEWTGKSLPSEQQFQRALMLNPGSRCNFDFARWDPVSVLESSSAALVQLVGNGWEWTSSVFAPFPGFRPFPAYPGYSANFFDSRHYVIKGASPRTAARLTRPSFRNWFRSGYPYVYAGFRLVENR
ncbi:MAG: SUMF1/EgtB/PvdO family nonheme iron enzyme [Bryobacteraceae bacterium]